jgi:hypothetical protein
MARPVLRIVLDNAVSNSHAFTIGYQNGETHLTASARIDHVFTPQQEESLRWYLEEYRKFPFEPASSLAKITASNLRTLGEELFDQLFNGGEEARKIWEAADEHLEITRIEVDADPIRFPVPWELLWNPLEVEPLAARVESFVRSGFAAAETPLAGTGSVIRILLVVSRPAGVRDASFRSVAARLLERVGHDARFRFEVLRPPTFEAFQQTLQSRAARRTPYDIVHFDGHGVHEDFIALREHRPASRRRGYLVFERPHEADQPDFIDAPAIGDALASGGSPILILNACRSARAEIWAEQTGARRPIGSLAEELMRMGQPAVVAMQYNVDVDTASRFVADLYEGLVIDGSLAAAVQKARRNLLHADMSTVPGRRLRVDDWLVPVLFEAAPRTLDLKSGGPAHSPSSSFAPANQMVGGDNIVMAIERAFQQVSVIVLSGQIGSGKTAIAAEFARWDDTTRDPDSLRRSPLHLRDPDAADITQLVGCGARVLIETRDAYFKPLFEHIVVPMAPLELSERITLLSHRWPNGHSFDSELWHPILVFSQGNPAVIENLAALIGKSPLAGPTAMLEAGRSFAVGLDPTSLEAEFSVIDPFEMKCLSIAALFDGAVSTRILKMLASAGSESAPLQDDANALFDRLSTLGLATPIGSSYYLMHPGLPGLLFAEFERQYPDEHGQKLRGAFITLVSAICLVFYRHGDSGKRDAYEIQRQTLGLIEPTIRRTLDSAIVAERWSDVRNLCAALHLLFTQQGRRLEWRQLATQIRALVLNDANGNPLPGREGLSYFMQRDHIEDLLRIHALTDAEWLQTSLLNQVRTEHKHLDAESADEFAKRVLVPELCSLGDIRNEQHETDAVDYYLEALRIAQRVHAVPEEQRISIELAALYISQGTLDWKEVTYWLTYASDLCSEEDRNCQARIRILKGSMAMARSQPKEAIDHFQFTLSGLLPADPSNERADCELKLAEALSKNRAVSPESMQWAQSAIAWYDQDQNVYRASSARLVASRILSDSGADDNAFVYAEEAARGFATLAPHAEKEASEAARLATQWRSTSRSNNGDFSTN